MTSPFAQPFLQVSEPAHWNRGWRIVWNPRHHFIGFCRIENGQFFIAAHLPADGLPADGLPADENESSALLAAMLANDGITGVSYNDGRDQTPDI